MAVVCRLCQHATCMKQDSSIFNLFWKHMTDLAQSLGPWSIKPRAVLLNVRPGSPPKHQSLISLGIEPKAKGTAARLQIYLLLMCNLRFFYSTWVHFPKQLRCQCLSLTFSETATCGSVFSSAGTGTINSSFALLWNSWAIFFGDFFFKVWNLKDRENLTSGSSGSTYLVSAELC